MPEPNDYSQQTDPSANGQAPAPEGGAPVSELSLEEQLAQAQAQAQEHRDAWLRAKAETENARKRAQEEVSKAHKYSVESFAAELLPVKDSLEAALAAENATIEALKSGVELTL